MSTLTQLAGNCPSLEILTEGFALGLNNRGYEGNIRFWVLNADVEQFFITVGGLAETLVIGGNSVSRLIPLIHPFLDPAWNCYADSIHAYPPPECVATVDGSGNGIIFTDYFIDVHFSTPDYYYELGDYPCCKISLRPGEERVTRPGSSYKFPSDGLRLNHDVGIPVKTCDFRLTMFRLPALSTSLYTDLIGTTNYTTFYGFPPGSVIYEGPMNDGQEMIAGVVNYTVVHGFKFRSIPHNFIMRPDGAGFEAPIAISYSGSGAEDTEDPEYLLPEGEHNDLWGY